MRITLFKVLKITNIDELGSTSQMWAGKYNEGIEAEVVGKSLEEA